MLHNNYNDWFLRKIEISFSYSGLMYSVEIKKWVESVENFKRNFVEAFYCLPNYFRRLIFIIPKFVKY